MPNQERPTLPALAHRFAYGAALAVAALGCLAGRPAQAQTTVNGYIANTSSNTLGLQVYLSSAALPAICSGATQNGWMMIAAANKAMVGAALVAATLDAQVTLYSDGSVTTVGTANLCNITQIVSTLR